MPAPNDLTPEEEQMFVEHGVQPAGPGREPVADDGEQQLPPQGEQTEGGQPVQQPAEDHGDREAPKPPSRHREDGTFKSKDEYAREVNEWNAQQAAAAQQQPPAQDDPQQQPQMVPHQALHAERQRAAAAIRAAQVAQARMNALLLANQQNNSNAQPQMPDLAADPVGYIQALEGRLAQFEQTRQQENEFRQVDTAIEQDETLFAASVPDYEQASDYYIESRARELLQFYPPEEAQRLLTAEARGIAQQAWQRGMNTGQVIYQLAQARGYIPGNPAANPLKAPIPPRPQGQQQPGGPQARIQALNNNQQTGPRSLGGGGGGAGRTEQLNAEALLNMTDEEFENYLQLGQKGANSRFAAIG